MKRFSLVWLLAMALTGILAVLLGVQYLYYTRTLDIRRSQTTQLAHLVLQDVARDLEIRELIRYLNQELNKASEPNDRLTETLKEIRGEEKMFEPIKISIPREERANDSIDYQMRFDSLAVSDNVIKTFLDNHVLLDEYILRNLYHVYSYDSIPQLVNPRLLRERLRYQLGEHGISIPFSISLCNAQGKELFRYSEPGIDPKIIRNDNGIIQRLFINRDYPNKLTPFIRLTLDFREDTDTLYNIALPGLIITIIITIIGFIALWILSRQISFQTMKTDFINNMTHELKTPVSSILLSVEQMQRIPASGDNAPKLKRYLTIMEDEAQRLRMLIDKVLQIALYDKNKKDKLVKLNEISVDEIIFNAAKIFSVHAAKYNGKLLLQHEAENTWVLASETHLTNVLYNLLENAVKYRREDTPLLLTLRTYNSTNGDNLIIEVEDNGHGVPNESVKRIFERFYRVSTGLTHNVKGHGLGLAYVHSMIKQFNGQITANNKAEGGLIITIILPTLSMEVGANAIE